MVVIVGIHVFILRGHIVIEFSGRITQSLCTLKVSPHGSKVSFISFLSSLCLILRCLDSVLHVTDNSGHVVSHLVIVIVEVSGFLHITTHGRSVMPLTILGKRRYGIESLAVVIPPTPHTGNLVTILIGIVKPVIHLSGRAVT